MSEKMLLSIIVPVYNVEKYINECLDSIFDPSVDKNEYEVIAVNDGSTDSSPEILNTYGHHKNFRIIRQDNAGLGSARNTGIKAAKGKYISFVDSDDYLLSGAVPTLLGFARESNCDIIEFDNQATDEEGTKQGYDYNGTPLTVFSSKIKRTPQSGKGKDIYAKLYVRGFFLEYCVIRIYKRDFLVGNSLYFLTDIFPEDTEWICRCFFYAETFIYYPILIYNYRRRKGSLSSWTDDRKTCLDLIRLIDSLISLRSSIKVSEENFSYLSALGDRISVCLEIAINKLHKSTQIKDGRDKIFSELAKRRDLTITQYYSWHRDGKSITTSLGYIQYWRRIVFVHEHNRLRKELEQNKGDFKFLMEPGTMLATCLEWVINNIYKSVPKNERNAMFNEIENVREVLGLATSKKGRRMYKLTRYLPAKVAFRMYKFF